MPEENYGQVYRQLRQNREITLAEVAHETDLSKSFISRFEREQTEISLKNFLKLLNAINVGYLEFFTETVLKDRPEVKLTMKILDDDPLKLAVGLQQAPFMQGFAKISTVSALNQQNYRQILQPLIDESEQIYRQHPSKQHHFEWLFYRCLYEVNRTGREPNQTGILAQPVRHYLQNVDNWGLYEIYLFQFFAMMLPAAENLRLLKIGIKKSRRLSVVRNFEHIPFALLITDFTIFLFHENYQQANEVLTMMKELPTENATNKINLYFYEGWYEIKHGQPKKGQQLCQKAIQLFQTLDLNETAKSLQANLDVICDEKRGMLIILKL
ncbi:helix-turn-helix domain-containing protein [Lapidilactobacillus bayanensis]|uniref:helix-turn-helix domain-containing protein n=1 Tax=Lapidilactobacillus bayanensis TaxID=2485998 RepID=UPI0013DE58E7|nr:Rgg/GadR/MutR family transcriptional regulator [Lapidilactobacillus bayanensis]